MTELFPVTLQDMHAECRRELDMRKRVYGNAVLHRAMNARLAARRVDVMAATVELLERLINEREEKQ